MSDEDSFRSKVSTGPLQEWMERVGMIGRETPVFVALIRQ